ncbi:MAG: aspartate aminotransferase family protein [Verrucomicrobiota bacterium]|nr:aspartate aminotransferase family protein [Verrucomicrobiota bacterium]
MNNNNKEKIVEMYDNYVLKTYSQNLLFTKGKGAILTDSEGIEYLDFSSGIGVCSLGHCNETVTVAIQKQAEKLVHTSNLFYNELQPKLAKVISENSIGGKVFFANSGAEANEGAIKLARKYGSDKGKYEIICMEEAFHGRTLATLAATGRKKYRKGFAPDLEGFIHVPFNDIDAVKKACSDRTIAIMLEPIQGEGGIRIADYAFLKAVRDFCDKNDLILIFDEVQSGMGRTGELFAYQHSGVVPDIISMAKALGNGFPIAAFEVNKKLENVLTPGTHASTFGGMPLGCAAALAVFEEFDKKEILNMCTETGVYLKKELQQKLQNNSIVKEIRGIGLMIGIEIDGNIQEIIKKVLEKNLIILPSGENVLRLLPPLNITKEEADKAVNIICNVIENLEKK